MKKAVRIVLVVWLTMFSFFSTKVFSKNPNEKLNSSLFFNSSQLKDFKIEEEMYEVVEELPPRVIKNLPQDINEQVAYFIRYFTHEKKEVTERWFRRCSMYLPYFKVIFREENVPEDLVYLAFIESGCNPFAVSRAGAVGIWQFMEGTAKLYGLKVDYWVDERRDFIKSTYAAARYLKKLYQIFGDWRPAVASYNLGEGRLMRILRAKNFVDYWQLLNSGSLPLETAAYLPQWMAITFIAKNPHKYGFKLTEENMLSYEEIEVNGGVDLKVFALAGGIDLDILLILNAELRKQITPPYGSYTLKVPLGKKEIIRNNLNFIKTTLIEKQTPEGMIEIVSVSQDQTKEILPQENKKISKTMTQVDKKTMTKSRKSSTKKKIHSKKVDLGKKNKRK